MIEAWGEEAETLDRRWALRGSIYLIIAFLCPLATPGAWLFGPTLVAEAPPAVRLLALVPAILGPALLAVTLRLDGLVRAVVILIGTGIGIIMMAATAERMVGAVPVNWGPEGLPAARAIVIYAIAMTAAFVGVGLLRASPHHPLGARIAGVAGAVLLAVHLVPLGGRSMLGLVFDPISWRAAWPLPLTFVASFAFAAACATQLLDRYETETLAAFAQVAGFVTLAVLPIGLVVMVLGAPGALVAMFTTLLVKYYGMWIALHALLAAGLLGLLRHGFVEPDAALY